MFDTRYIHENFRSLYYNSKFSQNCVEFEVVPDGNVGIEIAYFQVKLFKASQLRPLVHQFEIK